MRLKMAQSCAGASACLLTIYTIAPPTLLREPSFPALTWLSKPVVMCSIDKQATSAAPRLHPPPLHLSYSHVIPPFLPPQVPLMLSNHETALFSISSHVISSSSSFSLLHSSCCVMLSYFLSSHNVVCLIPPLSFFSTSPLCHCGNWVAVWYGRLQRQHQIVNVNENPFFFISQIPPILVISYMCPFFSFFMTNSKGWPLFFFRESLT